MTRVTLSGALSSCEVHEAMVKAVVHLFYASLPKQCEDETPTDVA